MVYNLYISCCCHINQESASVCQGGSSENRDIERLVCDFTPELSVQRIRTVVKADRLFFSHFFLNVMILILFYSSALRSDEQHETRR